MKWAWIPVVVLAVAVSTASGQTCTTQAVLTPDVRNALADAALAAGQAIKDGDMAGLQKLSSADLTANFDATASLARTTGENLGEDSLRVTQLYELDASSRSVGDTSDADFSCPLIGSASETDFSISGLPPGLFAFAMVEASGGQPWILSMLFRQEAGTWKLAGLYPHARIVAGHDGLWYWTDARRAAKAGQAWVAWLEYGEADALLRPAAFVSSTNLDKLHDERVAAAPPELRDGLSEATPYAFKAADGVTFAITSLAIEAEAGSSHLDLLMHFRAAALSDPTAASARNTAVAKAFLAAHPEVRALVGSVTVFADTVGKEPFATSIPVAGLG